ncbi:hypothetical protein CANCADRAFT_57596 [Tortispora caseinolytica NRRL Y-17796]|uniref:NADP-dependent oxidoreductase domain-containing protein n=1 Tax=Tortispora caseinolytica NRRL Y-17796 TaxID=767744 RepID=A0A1E4THU5_9ASCO|nr:hypothetical protein CANCADRAFT_57596 [Tortispora caseinolytica NRRL Y-17796]
MKLFKLNTGASIPAIGLGTWQASGPEASKFTEQAIRIGYRHIDTAVAYQNEKDVGAGIKAAIDAGVVKREDLFVTTKLWSVHHRNPQKAIERSLEALGLDYVDLYLMHWPVALQDNGKDLMPTLPDGRRAFDPDRHFVDTWKDLEKVYKSGKARAIGVSNCSIPYLEELLASATVVPAANQVELHPYLPQTELVDFCLSKGILPEAYSPLGAAGAPLIKDETVNEIAKAHNVGPGTVLINFNVARGAAVIPKTSNLDRAKSNLEIIDFTPEEMEKLMNIHKVHGLRRYISPDWGVDLKFDFWPKSWRV